MADERKKSRTRIAILIVFGLFLATFVLINAQQLVFAAIIYIVMGVLCLFLYNLWGTFGKFSDLEGIDKNFIRDGLVGLGLGIGTIVLGRFVSFIGVIGIPPVQTITGILGRFIVIVPLASIFEEVFFRDLMLDFFDNKLLLPKIVSIILTGLAFSFFHLSAYGGQLKAAGGSFFSAALMGFIFGVVSEKQNSLAGSIMYHAVLNAYLGFIALGVIIG